MSVSAPCLCIRFLAIVDYEKMERKTTKNHKVFFEKKEVCNNGTARYQLDLARVEKYSVTKEFAASVCRLPEEYDGAAYRRFIDKWGTVSVLTTFLV